MKAGVIVTAVLWTAIIWAQDAPIDFESLFDGDDETVDATAVIDHLAELARKPLDLNRATSRQLRTIPWLTAAADDIVNYRRRHGAFSAVEELKAIKSVRPYFHKIKYLVTVGPEPIRIDAEGRHRISAPQGGKDEFYESAKLYHRLQAEWRGKAAVGIMTEKDAGERFADLLYGSVRTQVRPLNSQFVLGHFTAEFGQRLVFGGSYNFGKGGDPIAPAINNRNGLYPYLSVDENYPLCGLGVSTQVQTLALTAFYSDKRRDARIENGQVISLPTGGLHRTEAERALKDRLRERSAGLVLMWQPTQRIQFGLTGLSNSFDVEFIRGAGVQRLGFAGRENRLAGAFGSSLVGPLTLFGEYAGNTSSGRAAVIGVMAAMSPVEWLISWRRYDENFHSFYASAFGEHGDARNETGFYFGCRYHLTQRSVLSFSYDQFFFPSPTTTLPMPALGDELMLLLEQGVSARLTVTFRFKLSDKAATLKDVDSLSNISSRMAEAPRSACRLQLDYQPSPVVSLRSRFEWSQARDVERLCRNDTGGVLLSQQIAVARKPYRLAARWTIFDAPDYPLRFYQVEQDVPGALRLIMLYGRGVRWYLLASYSVRRLQFALKFEQTNYDLRIGGGDGMQSNLTLQADWRF